MQMWRDNDGEPLVLSHILLGRVLEFWKVSIIQLTRLIRNPHLNVINHKMVTPPAGHTTELVTAVLHMTYARPH